MARIIHWREDVNEMTFDEFYEFHHGLFSDVYEAKKSYIEVTGKNPDAKVRSKKPTEDKAE